MLFRSISRSPWTYLGDREINPNPTASFDLGMDVLAMRQLKVASTTRTVTQFFARQPDPHGRQVLRFALWGLLSGCVTWALIDLAHQPAVNFHPEYQLPLFAGGLSFSDFSLVPGLVFGLVVGSALHRRARATGPLALLYAAAATVANFAATNLALNIVQVGGDLDALWIGMIAGLVGAACLTALSLPLLPFIRHWRPCLLMLAVGCLLGGLLHVALGAEAYGFLILYGAWQAGYAAALGTAVPGK